MAKKKSQKTNAIRLIEQQKIPYVEREFAWSEEHIDALTAAHNVGVPEDEIFKTLVTTGNKAGPVIAVIPGNQELDLKALARVSGNKKIEMLPLKELEQTTGYIRGGCSPVGMKKLYPTFIDKSALEKGTIHVSAGRRGLQMSLLAKDLGRLVKAQFVELIVK